MAYHFDDSRGWGIYDSTMIVGGGECVSKLMPQVMAYHLSLPIQLDQWGVKC